ncbi:MAG: flagellar biosynthetic protein FliR [Rhodobacteraceae bacterium]|jgi:type III secretion protein T|nr:flagellar biosynthetic protein FliR [Paracoccaceae bacterium]
MTDIAPDFAAALLMALSQAKQTVIYLALSAARFLGLVAVFPVFRRTELGRMFLAVIALALALPAFGGLAPAAARLPIDNELVLVLLVAKEFLVGAVIGLFFGVSFWAVQAVGEVVDHQRSVGSGIVAEPGGGEQSAVLASLLGMAFVTLFVTTGGLGSVVATVYATYAVWPLDRFAPDPSAAALAGLGAIVADVLVHGLILAAPLLIFFLLIDAAMMLLGRLSGSVSVSSLLTATKNLWFGFLILGYVAVLGRSMQALLPSPDRLIEALSLFAPG